VNNRFYIHSLFGVQFAYKRHIPIVLIEHASGHFNMNNAIINLFGEMYEHIITYIIKKYHPIFCGVSVQCNKWLEHYHIAAKDILPNAIDILGIEYIIHNNTKSFRDNFNISREAIVVCYAGRLLIEKGIKKLIEVINLLSIKGKILYLFIAGSGNMEAYIKQNTNTNIIFLGQLDFSEIITLLKDCDIFCLPTDYPEGFPTSILEAVACECFCISTIKSGALQLFPDKSYGILLKENTIKNLSKAIEYVIDNKEYRENAVMLAKSELLKYFTWDKTVNKLIDILHIGDK